MDVLAAIAQADGKLARHRAVCLNPPCNNPCEYRQVTGGRQRVFCSVNCRVAYNRSRAGLLQIWADLELAAPLATPTQLIEIQTLQTKCRWALARYGGVSGEASD